MSLPDELRVGDKCEPALAPLIEPRHSTDALLLREARHRIGNGLQIVAGILLQSARLAGAGDARGHLQSAYIRVMAVGALERQLATSSGEAVELGGYLADLCGHLTAAAIDDPDKVSVRLSIDAAMVDPSTAAGIGMIVTELVTNALKHAFPGGRCGQVAITYTAQGENWILSVVDNGVGTPVVPLPRGLGTEIVSALARQLDASVEVSAAAPGRITTVRHSEAALRRVASL